MKKVDPSLFHLFANSFSFLNISQFLFPGATQSTHLIKEIYEWRPKRQSYFRWLENFRWIILGVAEKYFAKGKLFKAGLKHVQRKEKKSKTNYGLKSIESFLVNCVDEASKLTNFCRNISYTKSWIISTPRSEKILNL